MHVDVKDLPPAYQAQALRKYMDLEQRRKAAAPAAGKESKYHNRKDERTVKPGASLRFDSRKEARQFDELRLMLQAGTIRNLKLQPQFTLQEAYTTAEGVRVRAIRYQADFSYERPQGLAADGVWALVVEDVKSRATRTREYQMKKKLMQERLGINITEV